MINTRHFEIPDSYFWVAEMYPESDDEENESSYWEYYDPSEIAEEEY